MLVRKLTFALLAGTALSYAGAAQAADVYSPPPEPVYEPAPEAWSWTGIHFGLGVGGQFDFTEGYTEAYDYDTESYAQAWADLGSVNWFGTVEIGADYQMGSMVIGIGANYDWHPSKKTVDFGGYGWDYVNGYNGAGAYVTYGDAWAVTARLGFLLNPNVLVYALAGWGQKQISAESWYYLDDGGQWSGVNGATALTVGGWQSGWIVGAGVEAALSQHTSIKVEYRYARYDGLFAENEDVGDTPNVDDYQALWLDTTQSHTVRAVFSYKFN